ncbi:MAG: hypothetical protein E7595_01385, partial [Ruminococcaceae bacterium]|nr:hypothetical protein [Oscillospiraceae bacterium]
MKTIDTTVLAGYNAGIERNRLRTGIADTVSFQHFDICSDFIQSSNIDVNPNLSVLACSQFGNSNDI